MNGQAGGIALLLTVQWHNLGFTNKGLENNNQQNDSRGEDQRQKKAPHRRGMQKIDGKSVAVRKTAVGQTSFFRCTSTLDPHVRLSAISQSHLK